MAVGAARASVRLAHHQCQNSSLFSALPAVYCIFPERQAGACVRTPHRLASKTKGLAMNSLPVGITMGDPAGIGPEIVAKLFAEGLPAPCIVVGDVAIMQRAVAAIGIVVALLVRHVPLRGSKDKNR